MKTIDGNTIYRKDLLQMPGLAYLIKIFLNSGTEILRYTNWDKNLMFDNELYEAAPITVGSFSQDKDGSMPEVTVTVANIDRIIIPILERYNAFRGCKVEVRTVFVDDMDHCVLDVFWVSSVQANEMSVTFSLASRLNIFDIKIPHNYYFKEYCCWIYKGVECGYVPFGFGTCQVTTGSMSVFSAPLNGSWWYYDGIYRVAVGDIFKATSDSTIYHGNLNPGELYVASVDYNSVTMTTQIILDMTYQGPTSNAARYTINKLSCANNYKACLEHNNLLRFGGFPGMVTSNVKYI